MPSTVQTILTNVTYENDSSENSAQPLIDKVKLTQYIAVAFNFEVFATSTKAKKCRQRQENDKHRMEPIRVVSERRDQDPTVTKLKIKISESTETEFLYVRVVVQRTSVRT